MCAGIPFAKQILDIHDSHSQFNQVGITSVGGCLCWTREGIKMPLSKTVGIVSLVTVCLVVLAVLYLIRSQCAGERWSVKTLSDRDRSQVSLEPVLAAIEQLRGLVPPHDLPLDRRVVPVELTTYVVKARVVGIEKMRDRDFRDSEEHYESLARFLECKTFGESAAPAQSGSTSSVYIRCLVFGS